MARSTPPRTQAAPSEALLRLMYCSISATMLKRKDLELINTAAILANRDQDITGTWLTYKRLNIQYLEGPALAVRALWSRIQHDPRHYSVVQLQEQEQVGQRWFANQPMGRTPASRAEMLAMVRSAYLNVDAKSRPGWAHSIAPLMILLDGEFSHPYTDTSQPKV